jgi:hypothetical protein
VSAGRWALARWIVSRRNRLGPLSLAVALAAAGPSLAKSKWWEAAEVGVKVHEHAFHRLTANGVGCQIRVRLYFDAPHAGYRDADAERNRYRFRAELKLSGGKRFVSEVFDNSEGGPRVFAFSHDTQGQGCWAEGEPKLRKLDVHACRGERCTPEVFE